MFKFKLQCKGVHGDGFTLSHCLQVNLSVLDDDDVDEDAEGETKDKVCNPVLFFSSPLSSTGLVVYHFFLLLGK